LISKESADAEGCTPRHWNYPFDDFDPIFEPEFTETINNESVPETDREVTTDTAGDQYLGMELSLPRADADNPQFARVTKRLRDKDGLPIGTAGSNPILDTWLYEVTFHDSHTVEMAANVINENMIAQVDDEGNRHVLFQEIADHRKLQNAVTIEDAFITMPNGVNRRRSTTAGWELLVLWKDGSSNWLPLKRLEELDDAITSSRVCDRCKDCTGASVCVVGTTHAEEAIGCHRKDEVKVLAAYPQIWYTYTKDSRRSSTAGQGE
jgi:hypothetical protein